MIVSIWLLYIIARRYGDCLLKCNTLAGTMGNSCSCWKKQTANGQAPGRNNNNDGSATRAGDRRISGGNPGPSAHHVNEPHAVQGHSANGAQIRVHQRKRDRSQIDGLVKETLELIWTLVDNDQEPPRAMLTLHRLADKENGWLAVVQSLIRVIPMNDPLGPAVVILLLDECPLPSKEAISRLCTSLKLSETPALVVNKEVCRHRNICVVLGCLAEKMAGPSSVSLLTEDILQYLLGNLDTSCDPAVILHSLVALEKFAQTSENKSTINAKIKEYEVNPIIDLEVWRGSDDYSQREVGFCATWLLDNLFIAEGRSYSYEDIDNSGLNAILNSNDVSEYLKIAPSGLEARCDASSFESVRCTFQVDSDVWYYEVHIITAGVMQIGFATRDSKFLNYEGYGIGDDEYSIAYDGCRQLLWYNAESQPHAHPRWKPGDVLGLLLDLDSHKVIFSLNGQALPQHTEVFNNARSRFFAAASFMSFQQCEFNFGHRDFSYPPKVAYKKFNDYGSLSPEERIILPRLKRVEQIHHVSVPEDSCTICCENQANVTLLPCEHSGVCMTCAVQLELCPMCREPITSRKEDS